MKIINSITIILTLSFLTFSCQKEVRSTPELAQIFNTEEIEDINLIVEYFEKSIQKQTNMKHLDSAYIEFAKQNLQDEFFHFEGFEYKDVRQLFDDIAPNTFENIWDYSRGFNYRTKDSIKMITIAYEKKYMNYMSLIGTKNGTIKYITDNIKASGSFESYSLYTLFRQFDKEGKQISRIPKELGDFNRRMIVAVTALTILEQIHEYEIQMKKEANLNLNK